MKHIKLFENFDEFDPFGEEGENILYFNQKFDNFLTKYNWLEHSEILKFRDYGVSLKIKIDRRKWKNKFLFSKDFKCFIYEIYFYILNKKNKKSQIN